MRKLFSVIVIEIKMLLRTGKAVFFAFIFPLFVLFFFGSIWGKRFIPYLVPMLIAMVSTSTAIYSIGTILPVYRESGILRRISVSPLKGWTYIYGLLLARFFIIFLQSIFLIIVAKSFYGLEIRGNLFALLFFILLGTFSVLSIGGLIAGVSKNSEMATTISNFTFTPLMFLSGAFIPIFLFPKFFQKLANFSPVYHFIKAMQDIIREGSSLQREWIHLAYLCFTLIVFSFITKKLHLKNNEDIIDISSQSIV